MDDTSWNIIESFKNNLIAEDRYQMILEGLQVSLLITFCAAILGTLLGGLVCWARMSRRGWLQRIAMVYIDLMRGMPVLVFLMLMYYVFMAPLGATGVVVAIVTFAMNTSAYIGEMLRSGIEGIDRGQTEAGLALGYTPRQVFGRIVLPQVVRKIMPVYLGEHAYALVKEVLFTHMRTIRPLTLRMTHTELSGVTALDFMVEKMDHSPLNDAARDSLRPQVKDLIEEPTSRGFRVKLII